MSAPALAVPGVLDADDLAATAASIAATQLPSGAIPWSVGGQLDLWDHVQSAMGLVAAGRMDEAEAAYRWAVAAQREDGSWPLAFHGDEVTDPHTDTNQCAYLATGVWHHWLVTGDAGFVKRLWPAVRAGIRVGLRLQRSDGAVPWADGPDGPTAEALLTGCASLQLSVRCAVALADLVDDRQPAWEAAAERVRHQVHLHPEAFFPKATHAMDWYYPVLTGAVPPAEASGWLDERWDEFVVPDLGVRCVSDHPWVTGGETAELALALAATGRPTEAARLLGAMQHLRDDDGSYWTGLVYADGKRWPVERTTWTGATVILAADAIAGVTGGAGLFRGDGLLAGPDAEDGDPCRCLLAS